MAYDIRPVKTNDDYLSALDRVEYLMELTSNDDIDDELDVLSTLIELYEDDVFPMDVPDPVSAIRFRMDQLGETQKDLVSIIGSRSKVSEILSGKRELTLNMIRALHSHYGIPAEVLIKGGGALPEDLGINYDNFPISEIVKKGWRIAKTEIGANPKDSIEESIAPWVSAIGGKQYLPQPLCRQGNVNAKTDANALQAWCLYVLFNANSTKIENQFVDGSINQKFLRETACLSSFENGPALAQEKLKRAGIVLVTVSHLSKTYLDGAALMTKTGTPVIGMTLRFDRPDNFWFCLLHELAHLGRHFGCNKNEIFIDDLQLSMDDKGTNDIREMEADEWAKEALIPSILWNSHAAKDRPTVENVKSLARLAQVDPSIVAGRIRREHNNYRLLSQFVSANSVRSCFKNFH